MKVIASTTGTAVIRPREYDIAAATAIEQGAVVDLTAGLVTAHAVNATTAILGIAAERHSGAAQFGNERSNGTKITVYDSPDSIHEQTAPTVIATGGTATTVIIEVMGGANDDLIGAKLKLISKSGIIDKH